MVLGFALNLGAFTSSVTLHSSFFSSSMDSSFLFLYTHSLCFAINQVLGSALSLAYLFQIIIITQDSSLLQPSYYYHLSNLYITYITVFVLLSCISLCTLIPNKTHSSIIGDSNQCLLYLFLFSSIPIYTLLYNLLYYQPNHLRLVFSLFHSVYLVIHFNDGLPLHSLVDSKQWDSQYLVDRLDVLNFPEETSSSTQALMCILILLYHVRTMFSCDDSGIHHLLSFTQCLFQNGVSSIYSVTIRT